ncbi:hypothetical protein KY290_025821 [Solanum tuberosum]|uniref:Uncharacterized protein n=1 Tax=Solanum tuberosum TaxID=4113 RepID=A0ABQ7UUN4_SOLTU|nr:hypothetical protein KY290_025821 [Solanum tuberosum]
MVVGKRRYCGSRNFVFLGSSMVIGIRYRLEHSAQLLKMRENFLPLHNVYLCRYLQRDLYPHCNNSLSSSFNLFNSFKVKIRIDEYIDVNLVLLAPVFCKIHECSQIHVAQNGHEIQDCNQQVTEASTPGRRDRLMMCECSQIHTAQNGHETSVGEWTDATNNSRRSFHSWKKEGSMDDVLIPIESYHMHDPSGTCIKHEPEFQQMQNFAFKLTVDEVFPPNYVWHVQDLKGPPLRSALKRFLGPNSISSLYSHQLPTAYFRKLQRLTVSDCGKLMSPSVARGALNLRILKIDDCQSMEEVITKEEEQGEGIFLTNDALELPFLREVLIDDFPEMKTFVQQGISEQKASQGPADGEVFDSRKLQEDEVLAALKSVCRLVLKYLTKLPSRVRFLEYKPMMRLDIVLPDSEESRVRFLKYKPVMRLDIVLPESEESCLVA